MILKVGDYVRIEPLSEEQKQNYPFGWAFSDENPHRNMDKFIGRVTKITRIAGGDRFFLECDAGNYTWSVSHLKPIKKSNIILF